MDIKNYAYVWLLIPIMMIYKQSIKGEKFPELKATTLSGKEIVYPDDLLGTKSLIVMVFED